MIDKTQTLQPISGGEATVPTIRNEGDTSPKIPSMAFTQKNKIKNTIGNDNKQLVIPVIDISGSMSGHKAAEAAKAVQSFGNVLADPVNKNGFILAVIHFNGSAKLVVAPELATTVVMPNLTTGGGTNFDSALILANKVVMDFASRDNPEGWDFRRPHIIWMSDGHSPVADKNIAAIHEVADVTAIAYGADADEQTLSRIASDQTVHVIGTNGGELRSFLAKVGETLSQKLMTAR